MKSLPIKKSFRSGEISPLLSMQSDAAFYKGGCETMENWVCKPQGSAKTRGGFKWLGEVVGTYGRIFAFPLSPTKGFVVIVTTTYIYITDPDEGVIQDQKVLNWDFLSGNAHWTSGSSDGGLVTFYGGHCRLYITAGLGITAGAYIRQQLDMTGKLGVEQTVRLVLKDRSDSTGNLYLKVGTFATDSSYVNKTISANGEHTFTFTPATTTICWIQMSVEGDAFGTEHKRYVDSIEVYTLGDAEDSIASPWTTEDQINEIQTKMRPGTNDLYFVSSSVPPKALTYTEATLAWTFGTIAITAEPADWAANGYPTALDFFQDRWWLGGTTGAPEDFWASKSGDWHNFTTGSVAADAMHYSLSRRGRILWMESQDNLVIGTENDEWIVTSEGGVVVPGDISARRQSDYGSIPGKAAQVGGEILYTTSDGRKVRAMEYERDKAKWLARDITFQSEHITEEGIKNIHFSKSPHQILWCETNAGTLLGCTYDPIHKVVGWHKHTTPGLILSACILKQRGIDHLIVLAYREGDGTKIHYEIYDEWEKMDSYRAESYETPTDSITGLTNLAGYTCQCLINGSTYHADVLVSAAGVATLSEEVSSVKIGFGYVSTLKTLPVSTSVPQAGETRGLVKRFSKLLVRVYRSYTPKIEGRWNSIEGVVTKDIAVALRGYDREAQITIEQSLPYHTEILGIFGEVSQDKT